MPYGAIEIKNFRGIKNLVINDLGDINIFVGRNNTGKSSCLEAIALAASGNSLFKNVFDEDMLEFITFKRTKTDLGWNYLIRAGEKKASIIAHAKGKSRETDGVLIGKKIEDLDLQPKAELSRELIDQLSRRSGRERQMYYASTSVVSNYGPSQSIPRITEQLIFYFVNSIECLAELYEYDKKRDVVKVTNPTNNKTLNKDVLFISSFESIEKELHDRIAEKGKLHDVIKRLQEKIPEIQDVRAIRGILYVFYKGEKRMPLATMGDGFKINLLITLASHSLSNGILILEEPENYLHPGLMMHLISELVISCKAYGIQIFMSTHNDEFIKFCLERSHNLDVSIIMTNKSDDDVEVEVIKKTDAVERMKDLGIDLRGF